MKFYLGWKKIPAPFIRYSEIFILTLIGTSYLYFVLNPWYGPAVGYEEVIEDGIRLIDFLKTKQTDAFFELTFGDIELPLYTSNAYNGALDFYLLIPFFLLLGKNLFAVRFMMVCFGLLMMLFLYLFLKKYFNRSVAFYTLLLLLFQPCYVLFSKMLFSNATLNLLMIASLYFYSRYSETGNGRHSYILSFLCGLGLWRKLTFVSFLLGLLLLHFFLLRDDKQRPFRNTLKMILSFFLGAWPFFLYNILSGGGTVRTILISLINSNQVHGKLGYNNLSILENIRARVTQFLNFFGGYDFDWVHPLNSPGIRTFFGPVFLLSLAYLLFKSVFKKNWKYRGETVSVLFLFLFIFLAMIYSPTAARVINLYFLIPFPQIIIALFFYDSLHLIRRGAALFPELGRAAFLRALLAPSLLLIYLMPNYRIINWINSPEYQPYWTSSAKEILELGPYIRKHSIDEILVLDKGLIATTFIKLITYSATQPVVFWEEARRDQQLDFALYSPELLEDNFRNYLSSKKEFYLFEYAYQTYHGTEKVYFDAFKKNLSLFPHKVLSREEFRDQKGRLLFTLSKIAISRP